MAIDIDGAETFTVEARRLDGTVVQSVTILAGDAGTGDGVATPWALDDPIVTTLRFQGASPGGASPLRPSIASTRRKSRATRRGTSPG